MVHGEAGLRAAEQATRIFFGEAVENVSDADLGAIFQDVPSVTITRDAMSAGINIVDLLEQTPLFKSKSEARRAIQQNGAYLNNRPLGSIDRTITTGDLATDTSLVIRKGKKNYAVVRVK